MKGKAHLAADYGSIHAGIVQLLNAARSAAVRSVNGLMTVIYWEIGRRIVEIEQGGPSELSMANSSHHSVE